MMDSQKQLILFIATIFLLFLNPLFARQIRFAFIHSRVIDRRACCDSLNFNQTLSSILSLSSFLSIIDMQKCSTIFLQINDV